MNPVSNEDDRTPQPVARAGGLGLKEIIAVVVVAVVFGFIFWVMDQAWTSLSVAMGPLGDLAQNVLIGVWFLAAPVAVFIVRRPGAGILAELVASVVEVVFLGNPVGPILFVVGLVQGIGSEAAFAVTGYRRYGLPIFLASGAGASLLSFAFSTLRFGWWGQSLFGVRLVVQMCSGILLGGVAAWLLCRALARSGVLRDLPAGRQ
ncbi:ECF transporter S component [Acidipropionibacterium thoenii]|uniref:ECF transporter S component n=1 Tax=Acidipropionibacterium thoenii TaxID=1751 RepID=UPI0004212755|nr:ECF transporter S component [Acidipropionibacterium thoenii]